MKKRLLIISLAVILIILLTILLIITTNKKTIVGKWKSTDTENYYYIFNKDKTCSYEMTIARLDCTYETDGQNVIILYNGSTKKNILEYSLNKNTLTIKDTNGKEYKFTKEKQ